MPTAGGRSLPPTRGWLGPTRTASAADGSPTADQCLAILEDAGLREPVLDSIFKQILYHTRRRADGVQVEAVVFSNQSGALAYSEEAGRLFRL